MTTVFWWRFDNYLGDEECSKRVEPSISLTYQETVGDIATKIIINF
jgi:hypothetical protein